MTSKVNENMTDETAARDDEPESLEGDTEALRPTHQQAPSLRVFADAEEVVILAWLQELVDAMKAGDGRASGIPDRMRQEIPDHLRREVMRRAVGNLGRGDVGEVTRMFLNGEIGSHRR